MNKQPEHDNAERMRDGLHVNVLCGTIPAGVALRPLGNDEKGKRQDAVQSGEVGGETQMMFRTNQKKHEKSNGQTEQTNASASACVSSCAGSSASWVR
jgi:hypothetical protein